jgi:predicted transcriptional regulator
MSSVIAIPEELAHELDRLAEAEHKLRTAYVVDVLLRDVRRNKQREALKLSAGAWNPADHPELAEGRAAHVEQIRSEPDERFEDAIRHQKR